MDIKSHIRDLETQILTPKIRASRVTMANMLSDDFIEFGSSGQIYDKEEIIEALACTTMGSSSLQDFSLLHLSANIILATFRVVREGEQETSSTHSLRSSIWRLENDTWKLVFHQSTLVNRG